MVLSTTSDQMPEQTDSRALALWDHSFEVREPSSASLQAILMQQDICISFMTALTSMLQPEQSRSTWPLTDPVARLEGEAFLDGKAAPATSTAGPLALSTAQTETSLVHGGHEAHLQMLVNNARAAIASTLASCRASTSQLQAQLHERDQLIQQLQMQVHRVPMLIENELLQAFMKGSAASQRSNEC